MYPLESGSASGTEFLPEISRVRLDERVLAVGWSADSRYLAAAPMEGSIHVYDTVAEEWCILPGHSQANSAMAWHPSKALLATCGEDGEMRLYGETFPATGPELVAQWSVGQGWIENLEWNADGSWIAAGVGRSVRVFEPQTGRALECWDGHRSTVCDITWNPKKRDELASVCDGGIYLWKVGRADAFDQFNWGGASLKVTWSPDGRLITTGDQTPSVHVYEVRKKNPLHIQGFAKRVRALAWEHSGSWLATTGGNTIQVWPCTGKKGPDGSVPFELQGHFDTVNSVDFASGQTVLISGAEDGLLLLWLPLKHAQPAFLAKEPSGLTSVRFSPGADAIAYGTADGAVSIRNLSMAGG